jgi:hypothetical protein
VATSEYAAKEEAFFVDKDTRRLMRVDVKTGEKTSMTDEECDKKFRKHDDCGGWFMSLLDSVTFHVIRECTKCGLRQDVTKKCDKCVE